MIQDPPFTKRFAPGATVNVTTITNPFDPREFERESRVLAVDAKVGDYIPAGMPGAEWVVSVNGGIVDPANYETRVIESGDYVVLCPVPTGGGGNGKTVLRLVAMIAVAVMAPYLTGLAVGAGIVAAGSLGAAALTVGITLVGSMLVNALLPVKPAQQNLSNDLANSTTYGIDGPKNVSMEGLPVPVCYGKHRMAGNVIGLYVENVDQTQMVHMLVNAGEGPVFNINELEINEQAISGYKNVEWTTRMGTANQELIDWFMDSFTARNLNVKIGTDFYTYTTPGSCDKLRFDFVCPTGLFSASRDSGNLEALEVPLTIEYRKSGAVSWTTLAPIADIPSSTTDDDPPPTTVTDPDPSNPGTNITYNTKASTQTPTYGAKTTISDKSRSAVRRSFSTPKLEYGVYEVRIKRDTPDSEDEYVSDDVYISDLNEITSSKVAYNHTALVAIRIKLTDQLSGVPTLTYLNHGRIIRVWNTTTKEWGWANSSNPAWIVLDMLTHPRYGGALDDSRIDLEQFKDWAAHCEAKGLEFNGVFDGKSTLWDMLQYVLRLGHAQLVNIGTRWGLAIERADTPVMMFGAGNIAKGSFKINWLPMTERANEVEVTFFDRLDRYKQKTLKVYDPAILTNGRQQRTASLQLFGCTDEVTAVEEGLLALNLNKYITYTAELEAPIEALACTVGSVVLVQHDMPDWAFSGRLKAGSLAATVNLDREVTFSPGETYKLLVLYDSLQVATGTVSSVDAINGYVYLNGYVGGTACKRIVVGGQERGARPAASGSGVYVDDLTGISPGQSYTLYDTDVIREVTLVNPATTVDVVATTVTVSGALPAAPAEFSHWMMGKATKVKRPFRVKAIGSGSDDLKRHLSLIQYDERAYDIDASGWVTPSGPGPGDVGYSLSHVSALAAYEEVYISGTTIRNKVTLTWSPPQYGVYKGADVWVSVNDEPIRLVNAVVGANRYSMDADVGSVLRFRVVAFDMWDKRLSFDTAPELVYTVTGISTVPPEAPPVTGLTITWAGKDCKIFWRYNSTVGSYEFGSEPYGADSGFTDPSFQDYEVRVYHNTDPAAPGTETWTFKRTEYVTAPSFIYTYEKNQEDGTNRHLKFEVRVRNKVGPPGPPSEIKAYNPPPSISGLYARDPSFETCEVYYAKPADPDFDGVLIWLSDVDPVVTDNAHLVYDGPNTAIMLNRLMAETDYWVVAAPYDSFGKTGLNHTAALHFVTGAVDTTWLAENTIGVDFLDPALRARIDLIDGNMPGSVNARLLAEASARGAAVTAEEIARQTADSSMASSISTVTAALAGVGSAGAQSAILAEVTAEGGMAAIIDALAVQVGNNTAAILNEATVRANADSSSASTITTLTATVNNKNRTFYQAGAPVSSGSYTLVVGDIWIETDENNRRWRWDGGAWVLAPENGGPKNRIFAAAYAFPPTSTSDYKLQTGDLWIVNNSANPSDTNNGRIFTYNGTSWVETPNAAVNANTISLQTLQNVVSGPNGLSGMYGVRIDASGYIAGFGLAVSATPFTYPDGKTGFKFTSEFEALADKFSIRLPSYPNLYPFTVGTVNGNPRVIIDVPLAVGDATIGEAKITDASIGTAKIKDANITTLKIQNNAVTIPVSNGSTSVTSLTSGGSYTTLLSNAMPFGSSALAGPAHVVVTFSISALFKDPKENSGEIWVRIKRDSTVLWEQAVTCGTAGNYTGGEAPVYVYMDVGQCVAGQVIDGDPATSGTYYLEAKAVGRAIQIPYKTLMTVGTMK